ncbi:MAG: 5'/3'-nucleotidase SurE [Bdellovibrionales bacterium]
MKKGMRVLITNDDGIDAPGLKALVGAVGKLAPHAEVWVVAPLTEQSGASQSFTTINPVRIHPMGERRFAVSGTPADCVVIALQQIMKDCPPDFVLSGVNAGLNIGFDVNLSGTLGAAFTGLMYGVPSIAISMKRAEHKDVRWETAQALLPALLTELLDKGWEKDHCLSINIPNLPAEKINGSCWTCPAHGLTPAFATKQGLDLRDKEFFWVYPNHHPKTDLAPDSDADALQRGFISISVLALTRSFTMPTSSPPKIKE